MQQAMLDDFNGDGPASVLPPGEYMITRYDWAQHRTIVVEVFDDKTTAEAKFDDLCSNEAEERASGKLVRSWFYSLRPRPNL